MKLGPEQMQLLHQYFQSTLSRPCAMCGNGNWVFDDTLFEVREFAGGTIVTQGTIKPMVSLSCNNCGAVSFVNAFKTGVIRFNPPAPQVPQDSPTGPKEEEKVADSELGAGG